MEAGATDVRSPAERALDESRAAYFQQRMGEKDLGYQAETSAEDPFWKAEEDVLKQKIAGSAAEKGFGLLRHGPSVAAEGAGLAQMGAARSRFNVGRRAEYMQNILRGPGAPTGRQAFATPGQESGLAALMGPAVGALGKEQGPQMGQRLADIGGGFRRMFSRPGVGSYPTGSPLGGASYT